MLGLLAEKGIVRDDPNHGSSMSDDHTGAGEKRGMGSKIMDKLHKSSH